MSEPINVQIARRQVKYYRGEVKFMARKGRRDEAKIIELVKANKELQERIRLLEDIIKANQNKWAGIL